MSYPPPTFSPTSYTALNAAGPAMDTSGEHESADQDVMGADIELNALAEEKRQVAYANKWEGACIPLSKFRKPDLCYEFPCLSTEILHSYLQHITVEVTIWVNYDSMMRLFFLSTARLEDCGKPYMSPKQRARLEKLDWANFEIDNLLLNIGTPFRTLYRVWLDSKGPGGMVGFRVTGQANDAEDPSGEHPTLRSLVENRMQKLEEQENWEGENGFTLNDIDDIAQAFVFKPSSEGEARRFCLD